MKSDLKNILALTLFGVVFLLSGFHLFSSNDHNDNMYVASEMLNNKYEVFKDFMFVQGPSSLHYNYFTLGLGNNFISFKLFSLGLWAAGIVSLIVLLKKEKLPLYATLIAGALLAFSEYYTSGFLGHGNYAVPFILLVFSFSIYRFKPKYSYFLIGLFMAYASTVKLNYTLFYLFFFVLTLKSKKDLIQYLIGSSLIAIVSYNFVILLFTDFNTVYEQMVEFHSITNSFRFDSTIEQLIFVSKETGKWFLKYTVISKILLITCVLIFRKGITKTEWFFILIVILSVYLPRILWPNYTIQAEFFLLYFAFRQVYLNKHMVTEIKLLKTITLKHFIIASIVYFSTGIFLNKELYTIKQLNENQSILNINKNLRKYNDSSKNILTISGIFLSNIENVDPRSSMGIFLERIVFYTRRDGLKNKWAHKFYLTESTLEDDKQYLTGAYKHFFWENSLEERLEKNNFKKIYLGKYNNNDVFLWRK